MPIDCLADEHQESQNGNTTLNNSGSANVAYTCNTGYSNARLFQLARIVLILLDRGVHIMQHLHKRSRTGIGTQLTFLRDLSVSLSCYS